MPAASSQSRTDPMLGLVRRARARCHDVIAAERLDLVEVSRVPRARHRIGRTGTNCEPLVSTNGVTAPHETERERHVRRETPLAGLRPLWIGEIGKRSVRAVSDAPRDDRGSRRLSQPDASLLRRGRRDAGECRSVVRLDLGEAGLDARRWFLQLTDHRHQHAAGSSRHAAVTPHPRATCPPVRPAPRAT